ncbi:MAG: hypothetical protein H6824_24350, partial [Planctomycetaceae bacterium]|nr:hypothetical protein [Planctomycetaceae bacterium]
IRASQKLRNRLSIAAISLLFIALTLAVGFGAYRNNDLSVAQKENDELKKENTKWEGKAKEKGEELDKVNVTNELIRGNNETLQAQVTSFTNAVKSLERNLQQKTVHLEGVEIANLEYRTDAQLARVHNLRDGIELSFADLKARKERLQTLDIMQRQGTVLTHLAYTQSEPILAAHHLASQIDNERKSELARMEFVHEWNILLETICQARTEIVEIEPQCTGNVAAQKDIDRLKTRLDEIVAANRFDTGRNNSADSESDSPDESPKQVANVPTAASLSPANENVQGETRISNAQIALTELMTQLQLQAVWRDSPDIRDVVRPHLASDDYFSILQPEAGAENDNLTDVALNSWRAPYTSGPKRFPELLSQNSRTVIGAATNVGDTHLITQFGSRTSSSTLPNLLVVRAKNGEQLEIGSDSTRRQQVLRTSSSNDYVAVIEEEHIELRGPWPRVGSLTATPISTIRPDASSDEAISFTDGAVSDDGKLVAAWGDEYENASLFYPSGFGDEWKSVRLAHLPENPCWHSLLPSNRLIVFNANCEGVLYSPTGRVETRFARPSTMASPPETSPDDSKSFHLCAADLFATKNSGPVLVRYIDIAPLANSTGQSAPDFREPTIYTWYYDSRDGTSDTTNPQSTRAVDDITGSQYASIGFTPDGRTVLTAEDGCYIQGSECPSSNYTKDVLQTLYIPTEGVPNWCVSANGKHLLLWVPPRDSRIGKVVPNQFASRGQVAADSVQIFDTGTGFPLTPAVHLHTKIAGAKFLPNENTSHGTFAVWSCEGEVTVWEFADNPELQQLDEETYRRQNPDAHPNETTTLPEIVKPGLKSADRRRIFEAIESYPQFENVEEVTSVRVCGPMNDSIYDFYAWRGNRLCRVRWHDDTRSIGPLMPISDDSTDRIIDVRAIPFDGGSQKLFILSKSGILTGNIDNAGNLAGELEHIPLPPQNLDAFITENATLVTCNRSSQLSRVQSFVQITELLKLDHASSRVFKHTENVVAARLSADETRLLTLSSFAPDKNSVAPGLLHVWDVETQREIIQPIPVADVSSYAFWFLKGEADQIAMFNIGASGGYILRLLDGSTSPQPEELAEDWRLSVVRKTGTYVDAAGELVYLDAAQWQKAKESKFNTYEDWYEAEVATTETADSLEAE